MPSLDLGHGVMADGELAVLGQLSDALPVESGRVAHAYRVETLSTQSKPYTPRHFVYKVETVDMQPEPNSWTWTKRPLFLQWIEDAKTQLRSGGAKGTNAEVATVMGLSPNSLKKYMAKEETKFKPGQDALRRLGDYLGRDYRSLIEGPDTAPDGINPIAWVETDEETKMFNNTMFSMTAGMTREQRKTIIEMIKLGQAMGKTRRQKP